MKKFEYKTVTFSKKFYQKGIEADQELNKLGSEGWECVNVYSPVGSSLDICYLFKREINV